MARRNRMLRVLGILALILAVLAPIVPSLPAVAQQETPERGNRNRDRNQNQNQNQNQAQNQQAVQDEAPAEDGERAGRFPLEVEVDGALFTFDRVVSTDPADLTEVGQQDERTILAESAAGPFDRVFVSAPPRPQNLGRYLAQTPPGGVCPAEALPVPNVDTGQATYAFAGLEGDVTPDGLVPAFQTEGGDVVYVAEGDDPPGELLAETGNGFERYVLLGADGRPAAVRDALAFNGQRFAFEGDVSGQVDLAALTPVGCTGPFRVVAETGEGPFDRIYAVVGENVFSYTATAAQDADAGSTTDASPAAEGADETPAEPGIAPPDATVAPEATAELDETTVPEETAVLDETVPAGTEEPEETVEVATTEEPEATADATAAATAADPIAADPDAFPPEVQVDDARFFRDRVVPVDVPGLSQIGESNGIGVFAAEDAGPFERVYGATGAEADEAARYLAELPLGDDGTPSAEALCLAEEANFFPLTLGEIRYAVAGAEPDLTAADLEEIAQTAAGEPIYAETTESPAPELFFEADGQLFRFVLVGEDGLPGNLQPNIAFGGQSFTFEGDVTGQVDPTALARVGCAGPYSARAEQGEQGGALSRLYVVLPDETPQVLAFAAEGEVPAAPATETIEAPTATAAPATPTAEPTATVAPTETPVPATATPELTATPEPTATAEPTETPVPPTETPAPTETPVPPTETPTPTETPEPTETPVPTETPEPPTATPEPTATVEPTEAAAATAEPTATAEATATEAAAAPTAPVAADVVVTPTPLPTVAPPPTPVSPIPVDAPAPVPPQFPREIQVQGVRYLFDLQVDVDPATLVQVDTIQAGGTALPVFADPGGQAGALRASFAQAAQGPFVRVYAVASVDVVARYLPQAPITPAGTIDLSDPCSAEASSASFTYTFEQQQYAYTFASVETQVSVEELRSATVAALGEVPTTDEGREILIRGGAAGFTQVFLGGDRLERYVALNAVGVPVTLNNLVFAETRFDLRSEVSVTVEQAGLQRVGCAGPFPIYAPPPQAEAQASLTTCFAVIENRVYQFEATTIVQAAVGLAPAPAQVAAPPPGVVQVVLRTPQAQARPTPTPLPNIRVVPAPPVAGQAPTPTPATGVVAVRPVTPQQCIGDPGLLDDNGLPERLPARIQLSGVAYAFAGREDVGGDVQLTRIGCVGPFEAAQAQGEDARQVIYLRTSRYAEVLYRYEAATSFSVEYVVTGNAQVITAADQTYVLDETWRRSVYSSVTLILYAQDPESLDPPRLFGDPVDGDVIAEYVPEGGDVVEAPAELQEAAAEAGINSDLVLGGGRRYLLVNLWRPVGTTTNGWVTLYSSVGEGVADTLLATDPRTLDLLIYRRSGT